MKRLLPAALAALLLPLAALAAETQTVVATGFGKNVDEAKKAAIRAAVEQVVGTMVDADTLVENDELVRDRILSYSAGLVDSAEFVGEPTTTDGGLVQVRIRAAVKKTEIEAKLPKPEKVVREASGQSLFAKRVSGKQNLEDAEAVMRKVFDPENVRACIKADLVPRNDEGAVLDVDPATGEVFADVKVWVDMDAYRKWIDEIVAKIGPMAESRHEAAMTDKARGNLEKGDSSGSVKGRIEYYGDGYVFPFGGDLESDSLIVLANLRGCRTIGLAFDESKARQLEEAVPRKAAAVRATLVAADGEAIASKEKGIGWEGRYAFEMGASSIVAESGGRTLVTPLLCANHRSGAHEVDVLFRDSGTMRVSFGELKESDLSDIAGVSVEVVLKNPPGAR